MDQLDIAHQTKPHDKSFGTKPSIAFIWARCAKVWEPIVGTNRMLRVQADNVSAFGATHSARGLQLCHTTAAQRRRDTSLHVIDMCRGASA